MAVFIFLLIIVFRFWTSWFSQQCIHELSWWLCGYTYIQGAHILRQLLLIYIWAKSPDPTLAQTKVDVLFFLIVILPEVGWYIYGNTFIYDAEARQCQVTEPGLWYCCLILVIYGYLFMLYVLGVLFIGLGVYCLYKAWSTD